MDATIPTPKIRVGFLGPLGSYSHEATQQRFPTSQYNIEARRDISDVFEGVQSGEFQYGVVPFANSTNGEVVPTLDLLADRKSELQDLKICGEIYVNIDHYLVGFGFGKPGSPATAGDATPTLDSPNPARPRSEPLKDIDHVAKIHSHPMAWGQCSAFLSTYLKGVERLDVSSTSKGAEVVAKGGNYTWAAISSKTAADMYGLTILAKSIQDSEHNQTRFLVLQHYLGDHHAKFPRQPVPGFLSDSPSRGAVNTEWKSLVGFTVDHNTPGALADALTVFSAFKLNLLGIYSRPRQDRLWQYFFFLEFAGRRDTEGGSVFDALQNLKTHTANYRFYGSWRGQSTVRLDVGSD